MSTVDTRVLSSLKGGHGILERSQAYLGKILATWHDDFPTPHSFSRPFVSALEILIKTLPKGMFNIDLILHSQPRVVCRHPTLYP